MNRKPMHTGVPLRRLPPKVNLESVPGLDNRVRFDEKTKTLRSTRYLTEKDRDLLASLSPDRTYQQAVDDLYRNSRDVETWSDLQVRQVPENERLAHARRLLGLDASRIGLSEEDLTVRLAVRLGVTLEPGAHRLEGLLQLLLARGERPLFYATGAGTVQVETVPISLTPWPRVLLVETYSLTSFYGNYGAGRTVNTVSLWPNEKSKISVKTWKTSETSTKLASSILDSYSKESSDSFEAAAQSETTDKSSVQQSKEWYVDAEVKGSYKTPVWGVEASVKGGAKGSTNSSRETFARNVSSATEKHVSSASAKRNVEVNSSQELKTTAGEEQLLAREVENVNAGRVLNFVVRQMNQEFITYLALESIALGFTDGLGGGPDHYGEFPIGRLEEFLAQFIRDARAGDAVPPRDELRRMVVDELRSIQDHAGTARPEFLECAHFQGWTHWPDGSPITVDDYLDPAKRVRDGAQALYLRFRKRPIYQQDNPAGKDYEPYRVKGIVLSKDANVLPTDSVIAESLLGQSEALDVYSQDSRSAVIEEKRVSIERMRIANRIAEAGDEKRAAVFANLFPAPKGEAGL